MKSQQPKKSNFQRQEFHKIVVFNNRKEIITMPLWEQLSKTSKLATMRKPNMELNRPYPFSQINRTKKKNQQDSKCL